MKKLLLFTVISAIAFSQNYDPETGELIQDSTQVKIQFDPETGIQLLKPIKIQSISKRKDEVYSKKAFFTDNEIINQAKIDAKKSFKSIAWAGFGGPATLWGAGVASSIGSQLIDAEALGGIAGLLGGAYYLPKFLSKMNVKTPYYYLTAISDNATQKQIALYKDMYIKEIISLREKAIYKGQLGTVGACVGFILFLTMIVN